eukprot:1146680-Pelagomonas_calceolata.AAC.2
MTVSAAMPPSLLSLRRHCPASWCLPTTLNKGVIVNKAEGGQTCVTPRGYTSEMYGWSRTKLGQCKEDVIRIRTSQQF